MNESSLGADQDYGSYCQKRTQLTSFSQGIYEDKFFVNAQVKSITEINQLVQVLD